MKNILNLNNLKSNYNKLVPFFIILLFIILNLTIIFNLYFKKGENNDILRLHVIANSNSIKDQITKLKVNEKINKYINEISLNKIKKDEIKEIISNNSDTILKIADDTIKQNDLNYSAILNVGNINYEKKDSINLTMDKGNYDSVKLILGEGKGENIWSLIEPNEENIQNIKELENIFPGISNLYENKNTYNDENISYDLKIVEFIKNVFVK